MSYESSLILLSDNEIYFYNCYSQLFARQNYELYSIHFFEKINQILIKYINVPRRNILQSNQFQNYELQKHSYGLYAIYIFVYWNNGNYDNR